MRAANRERLDRIVPISILVILSYGQLALGGTGVNADTKQWLFLDPVRLLERAPFMWDPFVNAGTVTHQNIGYLLPMGPFFALLHGLGAPDWLVGRLWIGTIFLAASVGAYSLIRALWPPRTPALVGAIVYGFSLYPLGSITGQSGLLLSFAALPWLVRFAMASTASRSWRYPALFAIVTTISSSLNGSSAFFIIAGALLWIPFAVLVLREISIVEGFRVLGKMLGLLLATQLWWLMAYSVGGRYGLPILDLTESVRTTSQTASPLEVLRGLGYWFFYGRDVQGPWLEGLAPPFLQSALLITCSFVPAVAAFLVAGTVRFRERAYFVSLIVLGVAIGTISFSLPNRSTLGGVFESLSRESPLVLSLRNTQRAAPLVILGLAVFISSGLVLLHSRQRSVFLVSAALVVGAVAVSIGGPYQDSFVAARFSRPSQVPQDWLDAADFLRGGSGRVLLMPGQDFASYRWGHTLDPVLPGLSDREFVWRELVPQGGLESSGLIASFDRQVQEGTIDPAMIVPFANALGITQIVVANDLEFERYRTALPQQVMSLLMDPTSGLSLAATFGDGYVNQPAGRVFENESSVRRGFSASAPLPRIAVFDVPLPPKQPFGVFTVGTEALLLGDGSGFLQASAAGLFRDVAGPVITESELWSWARAQSVIDPAKTIQVVTDSERFHQERFYSLRENMGATLDASGNPSSGVSSDVTVGPALDRPLSRLTTTRLEGAIEISASGYGNVNTLNPEDRPTNAFDGDPSTSWRLDAAQFREVAGVSQPSLSIELGREIIVPSVTMVQPSGRVGTVPFAQVRVVLDERRSFTGAFVPGRETDSAGLTIPLDGEPFSRLRIEILDPPSEAGRPVGLAEVSLPGVSVREWLVVPAPWGMRPGTSLPVSYSLSRWRSNPSEPVRTEVEPSMSRIITVPASEGFRLSGVARLDRRASDRSIDRLLRTLPDGVMATSSERLFGDPSARASSALDGDTSTGWTTPFNGLVGQTWTLDTPRTFVTDHVDVVLDEDVRRSPIRRVAVSIGGDSEEFAIDDTNSVVTDGVRTAHLDFSRKLSGNQLQITITAIEPRYSADLYSEDLLTLPASILEVDFPGAPVASLSTEIPDDCRLGLLDVNSRSIGLIVKGDVGRLGMQSLSISTCDTTSLTLSEGENRIVTSKGELEALQIDTLNLLSPGFTETLGRQMSLGPRVTTLGPRSASVEQVSGPFWVRFEQNSNPGWRATFSLLEGGSSSLGPSHAVGLGAAAWLVEAPVAGDGTIRVEWTPQRVLWFALWFSLFSLLVCVSIAVWGHKVRLVRSDAPALLRSLGRERALRADLLLLLASLVLVVPLTPSPVLLSFMVSAPLVLLLIRIRKCAPFVRLVPFLGLALGVVSVVVSTVHEQARVDATWPSRFFMGNVLGSTSLLLLAVIVARDTLIERRGAKRTQ